MHRLFLRTVIISTQEHRFTNSVHVRQKYLTYKRKSIIFRLYWSQRYVLVRLFTFDYYAVRQWRLLRTYIVLILLIWRFSFFYALKYKYKIWNIKNGRNEWYLLEGLLVLSVSLRGIAFLFSSWQFLRRQCNFADLCLRMHERVNLTYIKEFDYLLLHEG